MQMCNVLKPNKKNDKFLTSKKLKTNQTENLSKKAKSY